MRNIEYKARDPDPERTLERALVFGAVQRGELEQVDTYFNTRYGRLKLREENGAATLIPYVRADTAAARASSYRLIEIADAEGCKAGLGATLGIDLVVSKRRRLLEYENVRIHLDTVAELGSFVELEAVLAAGADPQIEGHERIALLTQALGIDAENVVAEGYAQLLRSARAAG